ncbi:MAG: hypothetical protein ACKVZ0_17150 [Gemmatimonadales bacterium]
MTTFAMVDSGLSVASTFRVVPPAKDLCVAGDKILVAGAAQEEATVVRRLTMTGGDLGRFGKLFGPPDPLVASIVSQSLLIECVPPAGLVIVASEWLPNIRAYDVESGRLVWEAAVPDFLQTTIVGEGRRVTFRSPSTRVLHKIGSLLYLKDSLLVAQLRRTSRPAGARTTSEEVDTRILTIASGRQLFATRALPRLLAHRGERIASLAATEYPKLDVHTYVVH